MPMSMAAGVLWLGFGCSSSHDMSGISSISGSASSSSGSSSHSTPENDKTQTTDKVSRLLRRSHLRPVGEDSDAEAELEEIANRQRRAHLRSAIIWFSPSSPLPSLGIPQDTQLGVHRALFPNFDNAAEYLSELRRMQLAQSGTVDVDLDDGEGEQEQERRITLLMVAGGHFAGMVVGLRPRGGREKQNVKGAGEVVVYKHKTFHRYTSEFSGCHCLRLYPIPWESGDLIRQHPGDNSLTGTRYRPLTAYSSSKETRWLSRSKRPSPRSSREFRRCNAPSIR